MCKMFGDYPRPLFSWSCSVHLLHFGLKFAGQWSLRTFSRRLNPRIILDWHGISPMFVCLHPSITNKWTEIFKKIYIRNFKWTHFNFLCPHKEHRCFFFSSVSSATSFVQSVKERNQWSVSLLTPAYHSSCSCTVQLYLLLIVAADAGK